MPHSKVMDLAVKSLDTGGAANFDPGAGCDLVFSSTAPACHCLAGSVVVASPTALRGTATLGRCPGRSALQAARSTRTGPGTVTVTVPWSPEGPRRKALPPRSA
jgi:hypothetical protein